MMLDSTGQPVGRQWKLFNLFDKSKWDTETGHSATWKQFIELFVTGEYQIDGHHTPVADHCAKCNIKWDFIIHQETMTEDGEYILRNIVEAPDNVTVGRKNSKTNSTARARDNPLARLSNYCEFGDDIIEKLEKYYDSAGPGCHT